MNREKDYQEAVEQRNEAVFSYIGKEVGHQLAAEFDALLEECDNEEQVMPEQTRKKLEGLVKRECRKNSHKELMQRAKQISKVCACIIVAVAVVGTVLMTTVDAFREKVFDWFLEEQNDYFELKTFEVPYDQERVIPADWDGFWYPGYLPEGYVLAEAYAFSELKGFSFKIGNDELIDFMVESEAEDAILHLDNSGGQPKRISLTSGTAYFIEENQMMIWQKGTTCFTLHASVLPMEELIKIAEHITYFKK